MQIGQEIEDHLSGPEVQIPGWLVGQQNRGIGDQGTGKRDPLLFAPGQLSGTMPSACSKPNPNIGCLHRLASFEGLPVSALYEP
jgi:hypothetical protein